MKHKYINQIFERADIQQIREFLLLGLELAEPPDKRPYGERLEEGSLHITNRLKNISKNDDELDELYFELGESTEAYKNVFLEIGMKAGARLLFQLLHEDK